MVQYREPGKELFVDWMGDTLDCIVDSSTGETLTAHFFVATLGDSSYPYVEAFPDEKLDKWLQAHVNALRYLGGVPRVIVPDNCKTATTKPNYYDPAINHSYWYRLLPAFCRVRSSTQNRPPWIGHIKNKAEAQRSLAVAFLLLYHISNMDLL